MSLSNRSKSRRDWPRISFRASTPFRPWVVDCGMIEGKRVRYSFPTKEAAEGKAALCRVGRRNEGNGSFALARIDRVDVETALEILKPHGLTLSEAARFYVGNIDIVRNPKPVATAVDELLRIKTQDGRSPRYIKDLRVRLANSFVTRFGTTPVHEITYSDLDEWLRSRADDWSPVTRNNYQRVLGTLFRFALKRGWILKDPTLKLERASVKAEKPGILSLDEARYLLDSAPDPFKPVIAIGLFAGLRPEAEMWHLDWSRINLEERLIDVTVSKNSASHRFVAISENLAAWLERYGEVSGAVCPKESRYYRLLEKTRLRAVERLVRAGKPHTTLADWPQDALRHTFASMHYAAFKHAAETAEQMGHAGGLRIFFRHYRNRVKPAEAAAFWQLVP